MPEPRGSGAPAAREEQGGKFVVNNFFGSKSTSGGSAAAPKQNVNFDERADVTALTNYSLIPQNIAPIWPDNSVVDIRMYVSAQDALPALSAVPKESLVLEEKNFGIGNYDENREVHTQIAIPTEVQHNGTLWAHFYLALAGSESDPTSPNYDPHKATHFKRPLNQFLPKKKARKLKNLLEKSDEPKEEESEEPQGVQIGSYYHPNFTVAVIPNTGVQNWRQMHPAIRKNIVLEPTGQRDASGQNGWYYPVVFLNTFWQLRSHMTELNETVKEMPLNIQLYNLANWKYNLLASIDEGMKQNQAQAANGAPMPGGGDGSEFEKFKEILLDTNAYLLGTTFVVSILHMVFEGLAFKNDISHWRSKKDNVGTSVRTILANVFMQAVIFLYLMDNSENTSWMILASQGFGILLEAWKITKTVDVRLREPGPDSRFKNILPYVIVFEDKHKLTEKERQTQEYDQIAFRYLYIVAVPLLLAYAVYSLIYESHKSWYSFVIETLVGSVYAYGFLMMVPSLYINYRLKSVAHMPSKALTYKFLNTFIDDLFAFTIRMPILHRLATLRDDVIFFVWLYQKYKYKVDYSRVNEFGQGGEEEEEEEGEGEKKEDGKTTKSLQGQDTKELKPSAPVSSATGVQANAGAKKRK
ncbi:Cleft lip and palate transmembrane protein 1 [Fonsecaea pedrosoi]|nr:Cleft lip and palate transmembrane protein 1 [Fonsecaea pedrosoi]